MLRLRTFGGLSIESEAGALTGAATQRRPLALLALLTVAGQPGLRRDEVLLYLWPESTPERARNVLKQTLYALRRDLQAPDLLLQGDPLRLNPTVISSDLVDFDAALEQGDLPRVAELFRGPFLDRFHLPESPEFERWRERERARLTHRFAEATDSLAARAAEAGDHDRAIQFWRRLATADPVDSRAALGLMNALIAAGDRAGALQHARIYETLAREQPGRGPDPAVTSLVEHLRTASPRSSQPVELPSEVSVPEQPGLTSGGSSPTAFREQSAAAVVAPFAPAGRRRLRQYPRLAVALASAAVVTLLWFALSRTWTPYENRGGTPADFAGAEVVIIAPFRADVADSALGYLREGMMDLLATKFTGEAGPRSVSPRTVMAAWKKAAGQASDLTEPAALEFAHVLGARYLVLGGVVGTRNRLSISTGLLEVASGRPRAQASADGPEDSLPALVDRLAAQLLVGVSEEAAEESLRLGSLTSMSLPALRAYLDGQAAYRRAQYPEAVAHFERALEIDSTFALAALRLAVTGYWLRGSAWTDRLDLAWQHRDRLSPRDRIVLQAFAGPNYPATAWWSEDLGAAERAVAVAPDRPEVWFLLGDVLFHLGPGLGRPDAWQQAATAFGHALELDSTFVAPLEHLLELAAATRDTMQVRRLAARYFPNNSLAEHADFLRWRVAIAVGDTVELRQIRGRFDRMPTASLLRIVGTGQLEGLAPADLDRAAAALRRRPAPQSERWLMGRTLHYLALNRGRAHGAVTELPLPAEGEPLPRWADRLTVLDALFGDGNVAAASRAATRLATFSRAPSAEAAEERAARDADLCVLEFWRLLRGDTDRTPQVVARLREIPVEMDSLGIGRSDSLCATALEAIYAQERRRDEAPAVLRVLDSLMRLGPAATNDVETFGNLVVARLFEAQGDPSAALAVVRRRPYQWAYGPMFLSSFLHEEQRLAALVGDTLGALLAARRYLGLRTDPDPGLADEVAAVQAALARLSYMSARKGRSGTDSR